MKNLKYVFLTLCLVVLSLKEPQAQQTDVKGLNIHPTTLQVSNNKTTSIVFPSAIQSVDRGSSDLLVQRSPGTQNVLQLKAAKVKFNETNLTVVSTDGKLHSFVVGFAADPSSLLVSIPDEKSKIAATPLEMEGEISEIEKYAKAALSNLDKSVRMRERKGQFILELQGVFVRGDHMFLHLYLVNEGYIPYDIQRLALTLKENRLIKRSTFQELLIPSVFTLGQISRVESRSGHHMVLSIPKMTLQSKKHLSLQVNERSGGRHLTLKIKNKHLLKAIPLITY